MITWITHRVRKTFIAGLLVTLPLVVTVYFSIILFNVIDRILGPGVTKILIRTGIELNPGYRIPGLGIVVSILIVFFVGLLVTNFIGRKLVLLGEWFLEKIPVVRSIYSAVKQIIETIASANTSVFKQVVMFEFPRKGIYSIGFISSETRGEAQELTNEDVVNVFTPTVPNITTGFYLLIPRKDLTPLNMSVEEGIKMMVSGGIISPKNAMESGKTGPAK